MAIFEGSAVAIITPFFEDGSVNYPVLEELIEFHIKNHTDAIVIAGTTGESSVMTDDDQIEVIRFTVEKTAHRIPVIAGTGSNETKHAIMLAKRAEEAGVDALLIVTPYYNKTTQKGLIQHYTAIAESVHTPIILYSVASRTGLNITPETVYALSKVKNIVGIKEASGDLSQIAKISALCGPDFAIYSGNDDQTLPILSVGGKGVISVLANVMPQQVHDMCQNFFEGKVAQAQKTFLSTLHLANTLFIETNPIPVKAAVNLIGFAAGPTVAPLYPMEEGNLAKLKEAMKEQGLI